MVLSRDRRVGIRAKDCPLELQTMFLPWSCADLPQGEGKLEGRRLEEAGRLFLHAAGKDLCS